MKVVKGLYYSKDHEWILVKGDKAYLGITDYAQDSLGDITFVEFPDLDEEIDQGDSIGVIESVKAASDLYTPVSGTVIEINDVLEDEPELLNEDPYENWIIALELSDPSELDELMNSEEYEAFCK